MDLNSGEDNIKKMTFSDRDEFLRKSVAEKAITLLRSDVEVSPLVIDGGWGTGKTEFCHKLINLLAKEDTHHLIYVDAFQADHAGEPLLTVLAEVLKVIPDPEKQNGLIKKVLPAIRYSMKTLTKAAVAHLLRQDATDVVDDFDKEIKSAADKAIDASVESLLKDHIKANESLEALQTALREIAAEKPIILFIDELDRCRPDFAVNMLEIIKHTFAVEGVQFVLITNTQQLKASINHCYGSTVDAQRYLDKFLKFTFTLPVFSGPALTQDLVSVSHYSNLIQQSSLLHEAKLTERYAFKLVAHLIKTHSLSLREVESLVRNIEIYQIISGEQKLVSNQIAGYRTLILTGIMLFTFKPELTDALLLDQADAAKMGAFFGTDKVPELTRTLPLPEAHNIVSTIIGQECNKNSELFTPVQGEQIEHWNEIITRFLQGDFNIPPEKGERSKIVTNVFNLLSLKQ